MVRIYLINLDRSPERLAFMMQQLGAIGLAAERISAIDGAKVDLAPYADSKLKVGEIGCFLSHRAAWETLLATDDQNALVLEDDIRLGKKLPNFLKNLAADRSEIDVLKLDSSGRKVGLDPRFPVRFGPLSAFRLCGEHTGTAGYVISRQGAERLLEASKTFHQPVDIFLFGEAAMADRKWNVWQMVPAVLAQEKRFGSAEAKGLQSSIKSAGSARRGPSLALAWRESRRCLRNLGKFMRRLPSRASGKRVYRRIKFDLTS